MSATTTATTTPVNTNNAPNPSPATHSRPSTGQVEVGLGGGTATSTASLRPSLSWQTVRSSLSLSEKASANLGWAVALLSVVFTIVALSPTFKSQSMSEKSLQLAEWTALKDYIEECREELAAGIQSQACLKAMKAQLPPPPYVKPGILDKTRRNVFYYQFERNGTDTTPHTHPNPGIIDLSAWYFWIGVFIAGYLVVLSLRSCNSWTDIVRRRGSMRPVPMQEERRAADLGPPLREVETAASAIVRHPPSPVESSLRRRVVRTHPIYRYANLEEAIYHQDLAEIRLRLQNGEDVNRHWPYLIYKLAISPPSVDTPKHLEVARLCLDFGADVNAVKGWNGQSALMVAIHFGNLEVAKLLIVNGAMVSYSSPDSNLTALHRCVRLAVTGSATDALEIMELLFRFGANPNQADHAGETALHKLLIDASLGRDKRKVMNNLAPVALCLVKHGALMPPTLKEKYAIGNPVWQTVSGALLKREVVKKDGQTPSIQ